eukprot:7120210-Prymnesium_polylepis.1
MGLGYEGSTALVTSVAEGSPAAAANLQPGDELLSAGGVKITVDNIGELLAPQLTTIELGVRRD